MKPLKLSYSNLHPQLLELTKETDHKTLGLWAADCASRVLPYFKSKYPYDSRPQIAIDTLREWVKTGIFKMSVIRKASLDSHAAARAADLNSSARASARAAGQAVATAHVKTHSVGAALYALIAIYYASNPKNAQNLIEKERIWQYQHLLKLINS